MRPYLVVMADKDAVDPPIVDFAWLCDSLEEARRVVETKCEEREQSSGEAYIYVLDEVWKRGFHLFHQENNTPYYYEKDTEND